MRSSEDVIEIARGRAEALEIEMHWEQGSGGYGGYWKADTPEAEARIMARATAALDFLERFAGRESQWSIRGHQIFDGSGGNKSMESGARGLADLIREWTTQVEAGSLTPHLVDQMGAREVAATDLLEQVRRLLEDKAVSPIAPIVLAGAALEMALRAASDELGLKIDGRPSITAYGKRLRTDAVITVQDMKDIEQMAGLRNDAAHGHDESLSRERAGLMEQQVNFFLSRLQDKVAAHSG